MAADAQQAGKVYRVGILSQGYSAVAMARTSSGVLREPARRAFEEGLGDLGWAEGRDLILERRFAEGQIDRLPALAQELVTLNVDVIVTFGSYSLRPAF